MSVPLTGVSPAENSRDRPTYEELQEQLREMMQIRDHLMQQAAKQQTAPASVTDEDQVPPSIKSLMDRLYDQLRTELTQTIHDTYNTAAPSGSIPTTTPAFTPSGVTRTKPSLPNVTPFSEGTHKEYLRWKTQVQTKLWGDREAYPTADLKAHYIISRTGGKAFDDLSTYVSSKMAKNETIEPKEVWASLDTFFIDPAAKQKALEYIRNAKQGTTNFGVHLQDFNLKLNEAGLGNAADEQKIDLLRNTLNLRILKAQAGYQPAKKESYDDFATRTRNTWENLQAADRVGQGKASHTTFRDVVQGTAPVVAPAGEPMDWQSTTVAVAATNPRTNTPREFWGKPEEVQRRRQEGLCLRCGKANHRVKECRVKLTVPNVPGRPPVRVAAMASQAQDEESSDEEGKE